MDPLLYTPIKLLKPSERFPKNRAIKLLNPLGLDLAPLGFDMTPLEITSCPCIKDYSVDTAKLHPPKSPDIVEISAATYRVPVDKCSPAARLVFAVFHELLPPTVYLPRFQL